MKKQKPEALQDRIKKGLEETRVVIPGTQALLGFQLTAVFSNGFSKLPSFLQYAHLVSLGFIVGCVLLLMKPVAYHRIGEEGNLTEKLLTDMSTMLMLAMAFLAIGLSIDCYVVVSFITKSQTVGIITGGVSVLLFFIVWFGTSFYRKKTQ